MPTPKPFSRPYRTLRGFSVDPTFSSQLDTFSYNETVYFIPWEDNLKPGPCGEYIEVIDVDPMKNCFYEPVDLNSKDVLVGKGLKPSETNPQFHQQFVYTITMVTIDNFEKALGRKIIWGEVRTNENPPKYKYVDKLRIHPHAFEDANAYYDPQKKAILYGYFKATEQQEGLVLPGGTIYTCLSPDIIAHETTHAILDSIYPQFIENTNPDVGAFHEGFADIVALLQRFSIKALVVEQIKSSNGSFDGENIFGSLATSFGQGIGKGHNSLRSAIGRIEKGKWVKRTPNKTDIKKDFGPHERGSILVATLFRAFTLLYKNQTSDLFKIANLDAETAKNLSVELVNRLADEACSLADRLLQICIQALDFLPPTDVTFGNYLRALITADFEMAPRDESGFRIAIIQAFAAWGIYPENVTSLSEKAIIWSGSRYENHEKYNILTSLLDEHRSNIIQLLLKENRKEYYIAMKVLNKQLHDEFLQPTFSISSKEYQRLGDDWEVFIKSLGLTLEPKPTHKYDKTKTVNWYSNENATRTNVQIASTRIVNRTSREGIRKNQLIVTIIQTFRVKDKNDPLYGLKYRGGSTLILDLTQNGTSNYIIHKNINSEDRLQKQLDYQRGRTVQNFSLSNDTYITGRFDPLDFRLIHTH